jgi:hypothetical protein
MRMVVFGEGFHERAEPAAARRTDAEQPAGWRAR